MPVVNVYVESEKWEEQMLFPGEITKWNIENVQTTCADVPCTPNNTGFVSLGQYRNQHCAPCRTEPVFVALVNGMKNDRFW